MIREFDLNIERVLENWTVAHALREVIANALDEQAHDDEVDRAQPGKLVPLHRQRRGLRQQFLQLGRGQEAGQPRVGRVGAGPHPQVGVAARVAGARAGHPAQRRAHHRAASGPGRDRHP